MGLMPKNGMSTFRLVFLSQGSPLPAPPIRRNIRLDRVNAENGREFDLVIAKAIRPSPIRIDEGHQDLR
jgi:hypothetical protein